MHHEEAMTYFHQRIAERLGDKECVVTYSAYEYDYNEDVVDDIAVEGTFRFEYHSSALTRAERNGYRNL